MKCWYCDSPPHASCGFCGRFLCKDHVAKRPSFLAMYLGAEETPKAIVVADVIWCGICEPQPEPIPFPELY